MDNDTNKLVFYVVTAIATIIAAIIAAIISLFMNRRNNQIAKEERFIDTISAERVKWVNSIRDVFSEYNKCAYIQKNRLNNLKQKRAVKGRSQLSEIIYHNNHIELYLNPVEPITKKLLELQNKISLTLHTEIPVPDFNYDEVEIWLEDLHFLQQIILKSEWKRIKEENKKGSEITNQRMNEIFMNVAKKIDGVRYEKLGLNQMNPLDGVNKTAEEQKVSTKYKYLHWVIKAYALLAGLVVINTLLSFFGINGFNALGSEEIEKLITMAGFLFTMLGLIPIIEEKYKYKK
ncbi:hypothetical protein [Bacillus thuringiensis]|uniref:hypothetical protein n=1 Tax=Bacillus thuringiensis TaxID=1428 RepID=UPI000BEB6392|nr:hypothetical protein [Bacillus thuringiensis]PDZ57811.1 hypothetical protein CON29_28145 [Bacillus thuringiensis]